ncbi:MAG: cupin domain-containing protein [Actinomycetia bacterium]|jgi:quercetin dioxygenase-like cupin family protein|nr:cupin domain-containing protein [Actinomycetes bacterium]
MTTATVFPDLVAELPVPEDGTLSRTLYQDDQVRLVGFAFAAGQELTEHSSALAVVIQVVSGRLHLVLGDQESELTAGGWVHLPARLTHTVRALEPTVMLLTMFRR